MALSVWQVQEILKQLKKKQQDEQVLGVGWGGGGRGGGRVGAL